MDNPSLLLSKLSILRQHFPSLRGIAEDCTHGKIRMCAVTKGKSNVLSEGMHRTCQALFNTPRPLAPGEKIRWSEDVEDDKAQATASYELHKDMTLEQAEKLLDGAYDQSCSPDAFG